MRKVLEKMFSDHYRDIYGYLYSLTHDAHVSEDLASEVFLEAVKSIASFRGDSDVKTWLFSIARRRWIRYLRKSRREVRRVMLEEYMIPGDEAGLNEWDERLIASRITDLIAKQPQRAGNVMMMRLEGYSFHEIALREGISESSARVIFFRAKERIRKLLEEEDIRDE